MSETIGWPHAKWPIFPFWFTFKLPVLSAVNATRTTKRGLSVCVCVWMWKPWENVINIMWTCVPVRQQVYMTQREQETERKSLRQTDDKYESWVLDYTHIKTKRQRQRKEKQIICTTDRRVWSQSPVTLYSSEHSEVIYTLLPIPLCKQPYTVHTLILILPDVNIFICLWPILPQNCCKKKVKLLQRLKSRHVSRWSIFLLKPYCSLSCSTRPATVPANKTMLIPHLNLKLLSMYEVVL